MPYKDPEIAKIKRKEYYERTKKERYEKDKLQKQSRLDNMSDEEREAFINERRRKALEKYHATKEETREKRNIATCKSRLKSKYGLTLDDYNQLLENQNHCCKICGKSEGNWTSTRLPLSVDHCHTTNKIRGHLKLYR